MESPAYVAPAFDPSFEGSNVYKLSPCYFKEFLANNELVLVMFYEGQKSKAKDHFTQASLITQRPNHAYAAVDCRNHYTLCFEEGVDFYPTFKLYSAGNVIGTLLNLQKFKYLKEYVEKAGVSVCKRKPRQAA